MYTYIIKDRYREQFVEFEEKLDSNYLQGTTLDEYNQMGCWVLLSTEQMAFRAAHPDASVIEVFNMQLDATEGTDQVAASRYVKLDTINKQDERSNKFYISALTGGVEVANQELWIGKDLRNSLYSITLPALQSDGETSTKLWTNGTPPMSVDVPISWAMEKLPLLEIYAKRTYDIRATNEALCYAATTVSEIEAIDETAGYPTVLTFELNLDA